MLLKLYSPKGETDKQTDGQTTYNGNTALRTYLTCFAR